MRSARCFLIIAVFWAALGLCSPARIAHAMSPEDEAFLRQLKGKVKVGMEIEMNSVVLSRIIRHFDFVEYQGHLDKPPEIPKGIADSYLDDPMNFDSLPGEVKSKLLEGLGPIAVKLEPGNTQVALVDARGNPLKPANGLIVSKDPQVRREGGFEVRKGEITVPSQSTEAEVKKAMGQRAISEQHGGILVPRGTESRANWQKVVERWKALPLATQQASIRLDRIHPQDLALLVTERRVLIERLKLRRDLPENLLKLYENIKWHYDGRGIVEATHKRPVDDPIAYLRDLKTFTQLLGIDKLMENPTLSTSQGFDGMSVNTYHTHESFLEPAGGAEGFRRRAAAENLYRLFIDPLRGVNEKGETVSWYNFSDLESKGFVRLVEGNHAEIREQKASPEQELVETLKRLNSDEEAFRALRTAFTSSAFENVLKYHSQGIRALSDQLPLVAAQDPEFLALLEEGVRASFQSSDADIRTNGTLVALFTDGLSPRLRAEGVKMSKRLLSHPNEYVVYNVLVGLKNLGTPESISVLADATKLPNSKMATMAMKQLAELRDPIIVPTLLQGLSRMAARPSQAYVAERFIIKALANIGTPESIQGVIRLVEEASVPIAELAIEELGKNRRAEAVPTLLRVFEKSNPYAASKAIVALGEIGTLETVPALIKASGQANPQAASNAFRALVGLLGAPTARRYFELFQSEGYNAAVAAFMKDHADRLKFPPKSEKCLAKHLPVLLSR